jgi:CheY-like chemotaxis protein
MRAASHFSGRAAPHTAAVLHSIFLGDVVDGSIFVLFVDDDTAFANAAAHSFQSVGMQTLLLLGSGVGIDVFDNSIDVIITDIDLPARKPQGLTLAQMIKNKRPHAPIILMTLHRELLKKHLNAPSAGLGHLEIAELCRAIRVRQMQ